MDLASFSSSLIRLIQVYGPWIISVVVALESAGVPLPGETILVAAALLAAATNQIDIAVVVAAAAAGAIIGDGDRIHGRAPLRNAASSQIRAIHSSR
jgi:membrane protein DedA with SNARE-associated domain